MLFGAMGVGVLALAGCVTGYSFVQPDATGTGGYYTSAESYPVWGQDEDADFGAYDSDAGFGDYGLYGPSFTFGLGLGSACGWSCAGYYGGWPWYYGAGYYGRRRHHGHHHHGDSVASGPSPRPWLRPDHARVPPFHLAGGTSRPIAVPERPTEGLANRRALDPASFAPRGAVGGTRQSLATPERSAYAAPRPPAFVERPVPMRAVTSHDFARSAAPARAAPPPTRGSQATSTKIR